METLPNADKRVESTTSASGHASATLKILPFTDIRGELENGWVYMYFTLNDNDPGISQFIELSVLATEFKGHKITLPSKYVRSYVKFGAQAWEPTHGYIEGAWDSDNLEASGKFELSKPSSGKFSIGNGTFKVTIPALS